MKKFSIVLIGALLILCLTLIPTEAKADTEGYFTYKVSGGSASITGVDKTAVGDVVIPDTLGGYPVTSIYPHASFWECTEITTITIPASITDIAEATITRAPGLQHIYVAEDNPVYKSDSSGVLYNKKTNTLVGAPRKLSGQYVVPDGVKVIAPSAFYACDDLTQVILPESVTKIGWYAFVACDKLESVNIPDGVQEYLGLFAYCTSLKQVNIPYGVTKIPDNGFAGCSSLEYVDLPETVTFIGLEAFMDCSSLKTIDLSHVTTIEEGAFDSCKSLSGKIVLAEGLTFLDICTFYDCESLEAVQLPESLTEIGGGAFGGCSSLKELYIPAGVTYVGEGSSVQKAYRVAENNPYYTTDNLGVLFNKEMTQLISAPREMSGCYSVPAGVVEIEREAFSYSKTLTGVILPEGVTTIGANAFYRCSSLKSVEVPETLTTVNGYAFAYCTGLTDIPLLKNVAVFSQGIFEGCTGFVSVTVPEGVLELYPYTFEMCTSLTRISLPASLQTIKVHAFRNCPALTEVDSCVAKGLLDINTASTNSSVLNAKWTSHTWTTRKRILESTCSVMGQEEVYCATCQKNKIVYLETKPHTFNDYYTGVANGHWHQCAYCDAHDQGYTHRFDADGKCLVCGYVKNETPTPSTTPTQPATNPTTPTQPITIPTQPTTIPTQPNTNITQPATNPTATDSPVQDDASQQEDPTGIISIIVGSLVLIGCVAIVWFWKKRR